MFTKPPVVITSTCSGETNAGTNVIKQEKNNYKHIRYENENDKPSYKECYFPEQTENPTKVVDFAKTKAKENEENYPGSVDPRLSKTVFTIDSPEPEEYLSKYLAACRTGSQAETTPEVAETFKSQLKEICNNSVQKEPNPEISTLNEALSKADRKAAEIIDKIKADVQYISSLSIEKLNDVQREAVFSDEKYILITGNAGTGKTAAILAKTKYLIEKKKIEPNEHILIISSSSNKAEDLKDKLNILKFNGFDKVNVDVSAFKDFAAELLKEVSKKDKKYGIENALVDKYPFLLNVVAPIFKRTFKR